MDTGIITPDLGDDEIQYEDQDIGSLQRELYEANAALQKAIEEKNTAISKADVAVMKSMKRPSDHAKLVSELICMIFVVKPTFDKQTKFFDYWGPALRLYTGKHFLNNV